MQTYSFVLTSTDSKWRFGFCRHDTKVQNAMIIITYLPWHDTFIKFLNVLGELKRANNGEFQPFLSEAYIKGVPEPGASLKLFYNAGMSVSVEMEWKLNCYGLKFILIFVCHSPALRLPTAVAISAAQHTGKSQSESLLQFRRSKEYDSCFCGHAGWTSYNIHIAPLRSIVGMRASGQRIPLSNGVAAYIHTHTTNENEGVPLCTNAVFDWCPRSSITNGEYSQLIRISDLKF